MSSSRPKHLEESIKAEECLQKILPRPERKITLAALGLLASIAAWLARASFWWLVAGILLGSVIPFTLIVSLPTNKRLLSPTLDRRSSEAERLLTRWGRLHAMRSVLNGLALLLFLYLVILHKAA